ncbi:MAG: peptide chain release factor N(5)-glutamine methyltransferase [Acidimicrobiales bacterium]
MTGASATRVAALVADGVSEREARWLVEEYAANDDQLASAATRRLAGEPLQYVIGHWPFRGVDLVVDPRVLIPRPETEGLVDLALDALGAHDGPVVVVDLGCGSGAILLTLALEVAARGRDATLTGVDASSHALDVARVNAQRLGVAATWLLGEWYAPLDGALAGRVDLIVANPPYVGADELAGLDPVLSYEPRGALVARDAGGVAGFADVAAVIAGAGEWLRPGGHVVVEHGDRQGDAAALAARRAGLTDVVDHDDLAGRPRVLVARRS